MLRVWVFGRVRFQADDGPVVEIKPERAQRLLAWLALEAAGDEGGDASQERRKIVGSLWAGSDASRPDNSLDQAIRELSSASAMGERYEHFVIKDGARLGLAPGVWVDAREFERLAPTDPVEALRLSDRPFLEWVTRSGSSWDHRRRAAFESRRQQLKDILDSRDPSGQPERPPTLEPRGAPAPKAASTRFQGIVPLIGLLVLGALGISVIGLTTRGAEPRPEPARCSLGLSAASPADRAVQVAPGSQAARRLAPVNVGSRPASLAVAREGIWVAEREGVVLIDPDRSRQASPVIAVTDGGASPENAAFSIAVAAERLWVTRRDGVLVSVDRSTKQRVGNPIRYGGGAATVAAGYGAVWVNNFEDDFEGQITRIDPCTERVSRIRVGRGANTVYLAYGSVWVTNSVDGTIERIDPRTRRKVASVSGLDDPQDLVAARGRLWVTEYGRQRLRQVDPETNRVVGAAVKIGPDPAGLTVAAGAIWVPQYGNGTLTRVDLRSLRSRLRSVPAGKSPTDIVTGFGRLWAPNNDGDTVTPVRP